ncbi:MAG: PIG-L deacetylase family protein [Polaromonas sp.]
MDLVNDRQIHGTGTSESAWLPWLQEQRIQSVSMNDLCPGKARLVIVAPHPDDEILACGGLLAMRAERGLPSLVIAVTNGEASHGTVDPVACALLGERRVAESRAGLKALGVAPECTVRLGIPDGEAAHMIPDIALGLLLLLKRDDVVLTTWGLDGHPDHEAVSAATRQAMTTSGCSLLEAPVWMWHWASPDDVRIPWSRLVALGLPESARKAKQDALSRHQSQLEERGEGQGPVLVPSIMERAARSQEYFFR